MAKPHPSKPSTPRRPQTHKLKLPESVIARLDAHMSRGDTQAAKEFLRTHIQTLKRNPTPGALRVIGLLEAERDKIIQLSRTENQKKKPKVIETPEQLQNKIRVMDRKIAELSYRKPHRNKRKDLTRQRAALVRRMGKINSQ